MYTEYTKEQIVKIRENIKSVNVDIENVLLAISKNDNIDYKEIPIKSGMSKFIVDKCLAALMGAGLVEVTIRGVKRTYTITKDGKNLLSLNDREDLR